MIGQKYELELPDVPPSLNRVGSRGGSHWAFTKAKKNWEQMLWVSLHQIKFPRGCPRVRATAVLRFPSKRRRDEGNFRFMLEKALGDALVYGKFIEDDDADRYSLYRVSFEEETGPKRTIVTLEIEE